MEDIYDQPGGIEKDEQITFADDDDAKAETDIEAQVNGAGRDFVDAPSSTSSPLPRSYDERLHIRVVSIDNLRTTVICLLVLQNAMIYAISTHEDPFRLEETSPYTFSAALLLVGMGKLLLVPILFFLSGFATEFSFILHSRSLRHFLAWKTGRAASAVVTLQMLAWVSNQIAGKKFQTTTTETPYYHSETGRSSLVHGPTHYILALLSLDYLYSFFWLRADIKFAPITSKRYTVIKYASLILLAAWIFGNRQIGFTHFPEYIQQVIYSIDSAELHFPLLYLLSYIAGINFTANYNIVLNRYRGRRSIMLCTRLASSLIFLAALYYYLPSTIRQYLDVRIQPPLSMPTLTTDGRTESLSSALYAAWAVYTLRFVPEALIATFFDRITLLESWDCFSRYAHLQIHVQLLCVFGFWGFGPALIGNVFLRGLCVGFMSICMGYTASVYADKFAQSKLAQTFAAFFARAGNLVAGSAEA